MLLGREGLEVKVFGDEDKILIEAEKDEKLSLLEMEDGAILVESIKNQKPLDAKN